MHAIVVHAGGMQRIQTGIAAVTAPRGSQIIERLAPSSQYRADIAGWHDTAISHGNGQGFKTQSQGFFGQGAGIAGLGHSRYGAAASKHAESRSEGTAPRKALRRDRCASMMVLKGVLWLVLRITGSAVNWLIGVPQS